MTKKPDSASFSAAVWARLTLGQVVLMISLWRARIRSSRSGLTPCELVTTVSPLMSSTLLTTLTPISPSFCSTCWLCTTAPSVSTPPRSWATLSSRLMACLTPKQKPVRAAFSIIVDFFLGINSSVLGRKQRGDFPHDAVGKLVALGFGQSPVPGRQGERLAEGNRDAGGPGEPSLGG